MEKNIVDVVAEVFVVNQACSDCVLLDQAVYFLLGQVDTKCANACTEL